MFSSFYMIADWIYRYTSVNIIWVIFNLPLVFLLFNLLLADNLGVIVILAGLMLLLLPFVFYPANAALFSIVDLFIKKEDVKILREFWLCFKKNYKRSMKIGGIFTVLWSFLLIDLFYVINLGNSALTYLFIVLCFFAFVYHLLVCSSTNYLQADIISTLKKAANLMLTHPILSISLGFIGCGFLYTITNITPIFLPFFSGSVLAFLSLLVFIKIHREKV